MIAARVPLLLVFIALAACEPDVPEGLAPIPGHSSATETPVALDAASDAPAAPTTPAPSTPSPSGGVDEAAVLAALAQSAYQTSPSFTEVTRAPYASAAVSGTMVREWVSTSALAAYEAISPEVTGSNVTLPVGAMIVRAVLDEDGGIGKLTVMLEGPAGYNPALGDWWFGVTDPSGSPLSTDAGIELGKLDACYSCHLPRRNDGYLFGVPLTDRVYTTGSDDAGAGGGDDSGEGAGDDGGNDQDGGGRRGGH